MSKDGLQGPRQRILKHAFRIKCVQRRNASVRDERTVGVEVIHGQVETPITILLFVDNAEEPERRARRALERENLGRFLRFCRFAVPVKHPPLLEKVCAQGAAVVQTQPFADRSTLQLHVGALATAIVASDCPCQTLE